MMYQHMSTFVIVYIVGYLIWLPTIYRAMWRDLTPDCQIEYVGVALFAMGFAVIWPIVAVASILKLFLAPKEHS